MKNACSNPSTGLNLLEGESKTLDLRLKQRMVVGGQVGLAHQPSRPRKHG